MAIASAERSVFLPFCLVLLYLVNSFTEGTKAASTEFTISPSLENATVQTKSTVTFACGGKSANSNLKYSFKWYKDGRVLNKPRVSLSDTNGSKVELLILRNLLASDAGKYDCVINASGITKTRSAILKVDQGVDQYWMYATFASCGLTVLLLLLSMFFCNRMQKYKRKSQSYFGCSSSEYLVTDRHKGQIHKMKSLTDPSHYPPIHLPVPGMGLPKFRIPVSEGHLSLGQSSISSKALIANGDLGCSDNSIAPSIVGRGNHREKSSESNEQGEYGSQDNLTATKSLNAHDAVYESFRAKENDSHGRQRSASEPPVTQTSIRYASIDRGRRESQPYCTLDTDTLPVQGQTNDYIMEDNNNEGRDTLVKRRIDKPLPTPRPKKTLSVGSSDCIPEERGDQSDSESTEGYLRPVSDSSVEQGYITANTVEPRYVNTKPQVPSRKDKNLYDAILGKQGVDEDDDTYYLRIRNSVYHKEGDRISTQS